MTAREKINEVVKEINELFGEDGLNAMIETKDEKKFFVVLDFNKNLLIWVGEVAVPSKDL